MIFFVFGGLYIWKHGKFWIPANSDWMNGYWRHHSSETDLEQDKHPKWCMKDERQRRVKCNCSSTMHVERINI